MGDQDSQITNRRSFLGRMGKTLAIGLGIAALPFKAASAADTKCCRVTTGCPGCPGSDVKYKCTPGGCCICHANVGQCFLTPFYC